MPAMLARTLRHVRANAIAYMALFLALSGTAIAATQLPKNSVGTKQIKKGAVNAAKVKRDSLTGNQINEASLGKVPEASKLDGKAPADFLATGGKAVDSERLDGVDSAIFGNALTYAGMSFEPRESGAVEKKYEGTGSISCTGTPAEFTYRAQLPEGARVTQLDFRYLDNEAGATASLELRAFDVFEEGGASTVLLASAVTTGASAAERTASAAINPPAVIDNGQFSYQLNWTPVVCAGNMELAGAKIHYTLPTG
jgi:hypothetical protein